MEVTRLDKKNSAFMSQEIPDIDKFYVERLLKHKQNVMEREVYNVSRIDIMIVSLATGGIVLVFNLIKFSIENQLSINTGIAQIAGFLFALCICINLVSQFTGATANDVESKWIEEEVAKERGRPYDQCNYCRLANKRDRFNNYTSKLNALSAGLLILGIIVVLLLSPCFS